MSFLELCVSLLVNILRNSYWVTESLRDGLSWMLLYYVMTWKNGGHPLFWFPSRTHQLKSFLCVWNFSGSAVTPSKLFPVCTSHPVLGNECLNLLSCHNEIPKSRWFKQLKSIFSQWWGEGLEVQDQGSLPVRSLSCLLEDTFGLQSSCWSLLSILTGIHTLSCKIIMKCLKPK